MVTVVHQRSPTVLAHFSPSPLFRDVLYLVLPHRGTSWINSSRMPVPAFTPCCWAGKCPYGTLPYGHTWAQTVPELRSSQQPPRGDARGGSRDRISPSATHSRADASLGLPPRNANNKRNGCICWFKKVFKILNVLPLKKKKSFNLQMFAVPWKII